MHKMSQRLYLVIKKSSWGKMNESRNKRIKQNDSEIFDLRMTAYLLLFWTYFDGQGKTNQ